MIGCQGMMIKSWGFGYFGNLSRIDESAEATDTRSPLPRTSGILRNGQVMRIRRALLLH
jgi:hypothetical protein